MKKELWNDGWTVFEGIKGAFDALYSPPDKKIEVTIPHDAMISETRKEDCESGTQSGFYPAKSYTYEKEFFPEESWKDCTVIIEFEGVMQECMVYLNNQFVAHNTNGYLGFYTNITPFLRFNQKNVLKVQAISQEKSSRWYTGCGIYRNVNLYIGKNTWIEPEGVRITTQAIHDHYAQLGIDIKIRNQVTQDKTVNLIYTIYDEKDQIVNQSVNKVTLENIATTETHSFMLVDEPELWSPDHPYLYNLKIEIIDHGDVLDNQAEEFGIRMINLDARSGLQINGKETKLRGACIHHDNGIIGARSCFESEYFRLKQLKKAGFNSIRSAHNPAGKDLLRACDHLGILVMDELSDVWCEHKNAHDYASHFINDYASDVHRMVRKDYNHPSVVLYSTGNEIPEIGRVSGARINRKLVNLFHDLDHTRFVTNAISGFLAASDYMTEAKKQAYSLMEDKKYQDNDSSGSEGLNSVMGDIQKQMIDQFSVSNLLSKCIEEVSCSLDCVGYNYLTARHVAEHNWHKERVVVGSETYPGEIPELWKIVKENHHVIGDFTWTGLDYLGEAGIGVYHYSPTSQEQGWFPDRLAYTGDIDINYNRRPVSYLREIVYGMRNKPYIMVDPPEHMDEEHDQNYWMYSDGLDSWTYPGYEGKVLHVHVLAPSDVELFLNDVSLGKKKVGVSQPYMATYDIPYQPGNLTAVIDVGNGQKEFFTLHTAQKVTKIQATAHKLEKTERENNLTFITLRLVDNEMNWNKWENKTIKVHIDGEAELLGFGSANPSSLDDYSDSVSKTYHGSAFAIIRSKQNELNAKATFETKDGLRAVVKL